jgi:hypothetical protein
MSRNPRLRRVVAPVLGAAALVAPLVAVTAAAPQAVASCPSDVRYSLSATNVHVPFKGMPIFKDGPGGTMTTTTEKSKSATYSVTAGVETEVSTVFVKAKASISASLTKTNSTSLIHSYSHKVHAGRYGHLQYVSWGKKVHWKKYEDTPTCSTRLLRSGTIVFPTTAEGWYYWESAS